MKIILRHRDGWGILLSLFSLIIIGGVSCADENMAGGGEEVSVIIRSDEGSLTGNEADNRVSSFRVLAFEREGEQRLAFMKLFPGTAISQDAQGAFELGFVMKAGTYHFVFIANEPAGSKNTLDLVYRYSDLSAIRFSSAAFNEDQDIPMVAIKNNLTLLTNTTLPVSLTRLAVRVDFLLESKFELTGFEGLGFDSLAGAVPLLADAEVPSSTARIIAATMDDIQTTTDASTGETIWTCRNDRIILPAKYFTAAEDRDKAVNLTLKMEIDPFVTSYPVFPLRRLSRQVDGADDYTLPRNTYLECKVIIKEDRTLQLELTAREWTETDEEGAMAPTRTLNVSHTSARITDFNGARITFESNQPVVKVLSVVRTEGGGEYDTEAVFNDLVLKEGDTKDNNDGTVTYSTSRFSYTYDKNAKSGTGYMDVLLDEYNEQGVETSFQLTLSAEDEGGGNPLRREITIHTTQNGKRFLFNRYGTGYIGAFYRNDQTGERVITGQIVRNSSGDLGDWQAWIETGEDFITLSTTPSFDPDIGTDTPGKPEQYTVSPNEYKWEDGTYVQGRGRVYFRIGLTNDGIGEDEVKYATVRIKYLDSTWRPEDIIYIRQGQADDYLISDSEYSRKIPPYNLTASSFLNEDESDLSPVITYRQGVFVEYPTQAGAFFQWGLPLEGRAPVYRAYHPTRPDGEPEYWENLLEFLGGVFPVWGTSDTPDPMYDYGYQDTYEVCPPGYHRPSDGYIDKMTLNGPYPNYRRQLDNSPVIVKLDGTIIDTPIEDHSQDIAYSEWRQSLFKLPRAGDAGMNILNTTPAVERYQTFWNEPDDTDEAQRYITFSIGFYADGYFDRRPIKNTTPLYSVSYGTARVAYSGILVYNEENNASVFFPNAGRRDADDGHLQFAGQSGYYNTASIGPSNYGTPQSSWGLVLSKWPNPGLLYQLPTFALSMRCVRDK